MKAISIFTGAGGLDIGFEKAGFETITANEIHPKYCETITTNKQKSIPISEGRTYFQNATIINKDIREVSSEELLNGNSDIDCLIGGPPCQAFSSAGKQLSIYDERGSLVYEYLRILSEIQPKTFLFENVRGLVTARGINNEPGEVLKELLARFNDAGYNCNVGLLNSADFGSYQRRVRCFIIGSRIGEAPALPFGNYTDKQTDSLFDFDLKKWRSLGEFLQSNADTDESEWVRPTASLATALANIPDGSGLKSSGRPEATRPNGHWGYRQGTFIADKSKPARTVTGSSSQDWIRLDDGTLRRLTFNEVKALQGFPDEWEFCGSKSDRFQQVGNAVPIVFGEEIGRTLIDYLESSHRKKVRVNPFDIPSDIIRAIRYTKRDNEKNGSYRVRYK